MSQNEAQYTVQNGEKYPVIANKDQRGNLTGYEVDAITPQGDVNIFQSKTGEDVFYVKEDNGKTGMVEKKIGNEYKLQEARKMQLKKKIPYEETMQVEKEIYQTRVKNVKEYTNRPDGLIWDPETRMLNKLNNNTASSILKRLEMEAIDKQIIKPNTTLSFGQPMDPSQNTFNGPTQPGTNDFSQRRGGPRSNRTGAPSFGLSAISDIQSVHSGTNSRTHTVNSRTGNDDLLQMLTNHVQARQGGTQDERIFSDPLYSSYAYRREVPELNRTILAQESCSLKPEELVELFANQELANGDLKQTNTWTTPEKGTLSEIHDPASRKFFLVKDMNPHLWNRQDTEVIRRLISTGPRVQEFEGFLRDEERNKTSGVFEGKLESLKSLMDKDPLIFTEDKVRKVLVQLVEALCHLENIGLHLPELNPSSVYIKDLTTMTTKTSNPFLYDQFTNELVSVYLNKYNSVPARAVFNLEYLQHNVYQMFLIVLSLVLKSDYRQYQPENFHYNSLEIQKALLSVPKACSEQTAGILAKYLSTPVTSLPTPILLASQENIKLSYNSYYGHSKLEMSLYYPFQQFVRREVAKRELEAVPVEVVQPNRRIPHHSEIDIYNGYQTNLAESRRTGIQHRRKNFIVEDGKMNTAPVLRPYNFSGIVFQGEPQEIKPPVVRKVRQERPPEPVYVPQPEPPKPVLKEQPPKPIIYVTEPEIVAPSPPKQSYRTQPPKKEPVYVDDEFDHPQRFRQLPYQRPPVPLPEPEVSMIHNRNVIYQYEQPHYYN